MQVRVKQVTICSLSLVFKWNTAYENTVEAV